MLTVRERNRYVADVAPRIPLLAETHFSILRREVNRRNIDGKLTRSAEAILDSGMRGIIASVGLREKAYLTLADLREIVVDAYREHERVFGGQRVLKRTYGQAQA